jgi:hypothetical protein
VPVANQTVTMVTLTTVASIVAALAALVLAKELPVNMNLKVEMYEAGFVHEQIMALKHVSDRQSIKH